MMAFRAVKALSLKAPSMRGGSGSGIVSQRAPCYMCKDTKRKSILQENQRISSDHFRSENLALKMAKPFVLGRFGEGRKGSEIGRKIFEKMLIFY